MDDRGRSAITLTTRTCLFHPQGVLTCTAEVLTSAAVLMSLWKHECYRVIADRFTTQADKDWFEKTLAQVTLPLSAAASANQKKVVFPATTLDLFWSSIGNYLFLHTLQNFALFAKK